MSEWQPIETAPTDTQVMVGKWEVFMGEAKWRTSSGAVWERGMFGRKRAYHGREYSHWKPLPAPPSDDPESSP